MFRRQHMKLDGNKNYIYIELTKRLSTFEYIKLLTEMQFNCIKYVKAINITINQIIRYVYWHINVIN